MVEGAVYRALFEAIERAGLPCRVLPDGPTLRIDETAAYAPHVLVTRGATLDPSRLEVADPLVVVEVLSSSTRRVDLAAKLAGYVGCRASPLPDCRSRPAAGRPSRARSGETLTTGVITDGRVALDPPGIAVDLDDFYRTR